MRFLAAMLLVACLAVAGCANSDKDSDNNSNRFGGLYGGATGGGTMP
jgi:ABC-type Fe3+-citrate transport system substrate-binding protein